MPASCNRGDPSGHRPRNRILMRLSDDELGRMCHPCDYVQLAARSVLLHRDARSPYVYFPDTTVVSLVTALEDGRTIEAALVGGEGVVGVHVALDSPVALHDAVVQIGGGACRVAADAFRDEIARSTGLRYYVTHYLQALMVQFAQCVACNRAHTLRQRACRWLLAMHDRAEAGQFALTQDVMATMLGVRRAGITEVVHELCEAGGIEHRPGVVVIRNRRALEAAACECYEIARRHFDAVFP